MKRRKSVMLREEARVTARPVLASARNRKTRIAAELAAAEQRRHASETSPPLARAPRRGRRRRPVPARSLFDLLTDYEVEGAPESTPPAADVRGTDRTRSRLVPRRPVTAPRRTDEAPASVRVEVKAEALKRVLDPEPEKPSDALSSRVDASVDALLSLIPHAVEEPAKREQELVCDVVDPHAVAVARAPEEPIARVDAAVQALMALLPGSAEVAPDSEPPEQPVDARVERVDASVDALMALLAPPEAPMVDPEPVGAIPEPEPAASRPRLLRRGGRKQAERTEEPSTTLFDLEAVESVESVALAPSVAEADAEPPPVADLYAPTLDLIYGAVAARDVVVPEVVVPEVVAAEGVVPDVVRPDVATPVEILDVTEPVAPSTMDLPAETRALRVKTVKVNGKRRWVVDVLVKHQTPKPKRR